MDKEKNTGWIGRFLTKEDDSLKKGKTFHWIIVFFLIGLAIMILSSFFDVSENVVPYDIQSQSNVEETSALVEKDSSPKTMRDYEKAYENQLTEVITKMLGVDEVIVKVNLDSTEVIVPEKNTNYTEQNTTERDKQGGTREITNKSKDEQVVLYKYDNNEQPLVVKTIKPKVRGVVVVAEGAENIQVKAMITEAVQRLLDVPPYKIAILPKKGN